MTPSRCRAAKATVNSPEVMPKAEAVPHLNSPEAVNPAEAVPEVEAVPHLNSPEAVTEVLLLVFVSQLGHSASVLDLTLEAPWPAYFWNVEGFWLPASLLSPEAVSEVHEDLVEGLRRINRHLPPDLRV